MMGRARGAIIELTEVEARTLYAELYRIQSDRLDTDFITESYGTVAALMDLLGRMGADL